MTIIEAMNKNITRLRLPEWEPSSILILTLLKNGHYGPWAEIKDRFGKSIIPLFKLIELDLEENRYEEVKDDTTTPSNSIMDRTN